MITQNYAQFTITIDCTDEIVARSIIAVPDDFTVQTIPPAYLRDRVLEAAGESVGKVNHDCDMCCGVHFLSIAVDWVQVMSQNEDDPYMLWQGSIS